jgi:hypothetical protein
MRAGLKIRICRGKNSLVTAMTTTFCGVCRRPAIAARAHNDRSRFIDLKGIEIARFIDLKG